MHHSVLLAFAIPLFTSFILLEMWIARKKRLPYFNLPQTIANVSIGIAKRACDVLTTLLFFGWFQYLQQQFGFFNIKPGIVHWLLLLLLTDFIWYWYHRIGAHQHFSGGYSQWVLEHFANHRLPCRDDQQPFAGTWTLSIFYPHTAHWKTRCVGICVGNTEPSSRAPYLRCAVPRQKLRRCVYHLGQTIWHFSKRRTGA